MEATEEFESWLFKLLHDAKMKLCMSDRTLAYILLREGMAYYLKGLAADELRDTKEHN